MSCNFCRSKKLLSLLIGLTTFLIFSLTCKFLIDYAEESLFKENSFNKIFNYNEQGETLESRCFDKPLNFQFVQRANFWVRTCLVIIYLLLLHYLFTCIYLFIINIYVNPLKGLVNFIPAERKFRCHESITLVSQADFMFIDNIIPAVERWKGPISFAVYAPGDDFYVALQSIAYLRNCKSDLVKKYVTFHVFFDVGHFPELVIIFLALPFYNS